MLDAISPVSIAPSTLRYNSSYELGPNVATVPVVQIDPELIAYSNRQIKNLILVLLGSYALTCALCGGLIGYLRYNRHVAHKGDSGAARKILLPSFEPLLWVLLTATGGYALFLIGAQIANYFVSSIYSVHTESLNAGRAFVVMFVAVFMLQKSLSLPALARTAGLSFLLAAYPIPIVYFTASTPDLEHFTRSYWAMSFAHGTLVLLYFYIAVRPPSRASKRSLREYCVFGVGYQVLDFAYLTAFYHWHVRLGFMLAYVHVLWGALCPLFVWRVLKADTEHWRGLGQRACALQSLFRRANVHERVSAQGLHVLIELHRRNIIDFAYLRLHQRIGVGSTATVYCGLLRSKTPVAIKVYTPASVTEDTVAAFSHEAALCGALHHPNIVTFLGMCVSPPTICLVSELCVGNLDAVTRAAANRSSPESSSTRQQFLIDLGYMIDAARAVEYLHSFSPAFVHRDIKPGNFLVDTKGNVKLTDFGDSRSLPKSNIEWESKSAASNEHANFRSSGNDKLTGPPQPAGSMIASPMTSTATPSSDQSYLELTSSELVLSIHSQSTAPPLSVARKTTTTPQMTVTGTVDYMAPEIISGKAGVASYAEAADVYALAITMWDVLNPGIEKYPSSNSNHLRIFETVMAGSRPVLDESIHPSLRALIGAAWSDEPGSRPTAAMVVRVLESIQEEVSSTFALELCEKLDQDSVILRTDNALVKSFSSGRMAQKMQELSAASSIGESVRLGNMLMNAGFLHHIKHMRPFDVGDDMFFFDIDSIQTCEPVAMLELCDGRIRDDAVDATSAEPTGAVLLFQSRQRGSQASPLGRSIHRRLLLSKQSHENVLENADSVDEDGSTISNSAMECGSDNGSTSSRRGHSLKKCECRLLGQREGTRKSTRRGRHRLRPKHRAIPEEEAALTANLLEDDERHLSGSHVSNGLHSRDNSVFDGFDACSSSAPALPV